MRASQDSTARYAALAAALASLLAPGADVALAGETVVSAPSATADLHVPSPDWRDQVIYFVMIDRFDDADPSNNDQGVGEYDPADPSHYSGGDLAGITRRLDYLPAHLGILVTHVAPLEVIAELLVRPELMAPNGFLHAGSIVSLADTCSGYGCLANLPEGAAGFTTIELKSNHPGTARDGTIVCVAKAAHAGKSTQVWDAIVTHKETGRTLALFRCTQMVLYAKQGA